MKLLLTALSMLTLTTTAFAAAQDPVAGALEKQFQAGSPDFSNFQGGNYDCTATFSDSGSVHSTLSIAPKGGAFEGVAADAPNDRILLVGTANGLQASIDSDTLTFRKGEKDSLIAKAETPAEDGKSGTEVDGYMICSKI